MGNADFPIQIPHPDSIIPLLSTDSMLYIGGIWGSVKSGQTFMASDGERFVWSADGLQVIYSQNSNFYTQTAEVSPTKSVPIPPLPPAAARPLGW